MVSTVPVGPSKGKRGTVKGFVYEYVAIEFDDHPGWVKLLPYFVVREDAH